ncbi:sulfotransferase domain-containing protein, partial [Moorena sp. SIO3I8]|uniref:sulfotransferase domain-containing protein n=1 Tax=Moorena sp. SIO3I8 TaxID=2607833 RepID=UPI0013C039DC|nr:sulfotransferase domain-containing protein [Moorena sp. SIO3I8]
MSWVALRTDTWTDELVQSKANYKNAKVILLVRDPRDVVVSIYFEHTKRVGHYA